MSGTGIWLIELTRLYPKSQAETFPGLEEHFKVRDLLIHNIRQLFEEKPVNIFNLLQNRNFISEFKKVFILELFGGEIYQLI